MGKKRKQIGRVMLEMLIFIGIMAMISPFVYRKVTDKMIEREDIGIADNLRILRDAAKVYIDSGDRMICRINETDPPPPTEPAECASGWAFTKTLSQDDIIRYIPEGAKINTKVYDSFMLGIRCSVELVGNDCRLSVSGLVLTKGGSGELNDMRGNRIASMVGGEGGYIRSLAAGAAPDDFTVYGAGAAWQLDATNYFEPSGLQPHHGRVAVLVRGRESGNLDGRILYRERIAGFDDANKMLTNLDMGRNNIMNIGDVDARYITVLGREGHNMIEMDTRNKDNLMRLRGRGADGRTDVTITIDGNTGIIHMAKYADVFNAPDQEDPETHSWSVSGTTTEERLCIRRDADGNCTEYGYGVDADGVSMLKDLRIQSIGGATLGGAAPRWSLMDIRRGLSNGMFVPAPGYTDASEASKSIRDNDKNTCPVGFAPVMILNRANKDCKPLTGVPTLEQARCYWPNPDYLPFFNGQVDIPPITGPNPLKDFVVASRSLGFSGGNIQPFNEWMGTQILMYGTVPNIRDVPEFVKHGFTPVYDNMECHFRNATILSSKDVFPQLVTDGCKPKPLTFLLDLIKLSSQARAQDAGGGGGDGDSGDSGGDGDTTTTHSYGCPKVCPPSKDWDGHMRGSGSFDLPGYLAPYWSVLISDAGSNNGYACWFDFIKLSSQAHAQDAGGGGGDGGGDSGGGGGGGDSGGGGRPFMCPRECCLTCWRGEYGLRGGNYCKVMAGRLNRPVRMRLPSSEAFGINDGIPEYRPGSPDHRMFDRCGSQICDECCYDPCPKTPCGPGFKQYEYINYCRTRTGAQGGETGTGKCYICVPLGEEYDCDPEDPRGICRPGEEKPDYEVTFPDGSKKMCPGCGGGDECKPCPSDGSYRPPYLNGNKELCPECPETCTPCELGESRDGYWYRDVGGVRKWCPGCGDDRKNRWCRGEALYARFKPGTWGTLAQRGQNVSVSQTVADRRVVQTQSMHVAVPYIDMMDWSWGRGYTETDPSKYVKFEVCQSAKREEYNPSAELRSLGFGGRYTSRDCPIEDGWMFATRRMEDGELDRDTGRAEARFYEPWRHSREVFYFIRIPISQFSRIGGKEVGGLWNVGGLGAANSENRGRETIGWTVSIKAKENMDGYVYCKYNEGAFDYSR